MISCGRDEELEGLLLDFRWTQRQTEVSGIGLMSDFEMLEMELDRILEQNENKNDDGNTSELRSRIFALSHIWRSFCSSWPFVMVNRIEPPTHMYGRLFFRRGSNEWISSYMNNLEERARMPWLRTIVRCMDTPSGDMIARRNFGNRVLYVASVCDNERVVVGGEGGMLLAVDSESRAELQRFTGHSRDVFCVAALSDGRYVVSGSEDRTRRVWDAMRGDLTGVLCMFSFVDSLALSRDERKLAFFCWDGCLGVRRFPQVNEVVDHMNLREVVNPTRSCSFPPVVATNGDGRIVVSGISDGIIHLWDGDTGAPIGSAMHGHNAWILCILMTENASRIVSGAKDDMFVWDAERCTCLA